MAKIYGTKTSDVLNGTAQSDELFGQEGNDTLYGNDGDDYLVGGAGADLMVGGNGNDTYFVDDIGDRVLELKYFSSGIDTVKSSISYTLPERVENLYLTGTAALDGTGNDSDNLMFGNSGNNRLSGEAGDDDIRGLDGNDWIDGGDGNDHLYGNNGSDTLLGGNGNDVLDGGAGIDHMAGGMGNDTYWVDSPFDQVWDLPSFGGTDTVMSTTSFALAEGNNIENLTLVGTSGIGGVGNALNNILTGNAAGNQLRGGGGNDQLFGMGGNDLLYGDDGNDSLYGGEGDDWLYGGDGDDWLDGGSGPDIMSGGTGNDIYVFDDLGDRAFESVLASGGVDQVRSSVSVTLSAGIENLALMGTAAIDGTGNELDNLMAGNGRDNVMHGGAGQDVIFGGDGNDSLYGDGDADQLYGGDGRDDLHGGSGDDLMYGGDGDDTLDGDNGHDTMYGGLGDDLYRVNDSGDIAIDALNGVGGGYDTVQSTASNYQLAANSGIEKLVLMSGAYGGVGNALDNVIEGNGTGNLLDGGSGDDILSGGGGHDIVKGGLGDDVINGGAGVDTLYGGDGSLHSSGDRDTFVFSSAAEAWGDTVWDFHHGRDRIDLSGIDANGSTLNINEAFVFIGSAAFDANDATGQVRFENGVLYGSINANPTADFHITLMGTVELTAGDLVL
jgi:Ca2+-binding RTX toxin-like protein